MLQRPYSAVKNTFGETNAPLVEHDQPRERSKAIEEMAGVRMIPPELHIGRAPANEDDVERAVADDLVGDVDVAALREPRLGLHAGQLAPARALASTAPQSRTTWFACRYRSRNPHGTKRLPLANVASGTTSAARRSAQAACRIGPCEHLPLLPASQSIGR